MSSKLRDFFKSKVVTATENNAIDNAQRNAGVPAKPKVGSQGTSSLGSDEKQEMTRLEEARHGTNITTVPAKPSSKTCPTAGGKSTPNMANRARAAGMQRLKTQFTLPPAPRCKVYCDTPGGHTGGENGDHSMMVHYLMKEARATAATSNVDCLINGVGIEVKPDVPSDVTINGTRYESETNNQMRAAKILVCYRTLRAYSDGDTSIHSEYNAIAYALKKLEDIIPPNDMFTFRDDSRRSSWDRRCGHLKTPMMYVYKLLKPAAMNEYLMMGHTLKTTFNEDGDKKEGGKLMPAMQIAGDLVSQAACMSTGLPVNDDQLREYVRTEEFIRAKAPEDKVFSRVDSVVKVRCKVIDSDPTRKKMYCQWFGQVDGGVMFLTRELDMQFRDIMPLENNRKAFHELARSGVGAMGNIIMGFMFGRRMSGRAGAEDLSRIYAVLTIPNILTSLYALRLDGISSKYQPKASSADPIAHILCKLPPRVPTKDLMNCTRSDPSSLEAIPSTATAFDFSPVKYDTGRFRIPDDDDYFPDFAKAMVVDGPALEWAAPPVQMVKTTLVTTTNTSDVIDEKSWAPDTPEYYQAQYWAMTMPEIARTDEITMDKVRAVPELEGQRDRETFFGNRAPVWLTGNSHAISAGRVIVPTVPWPKHTNPWAFTESSMRMTVKDSMMVEELSSLDCSLLSVFMMLRQASNTRKAGEAPINTYELVEPVRQAYSRGRTITRMAQPSWMSEETDQAKAFHAKSLFSMDETVCLAMLSGIITTQFTERKIKSGADSVTGIPIPGARGGFKWAPSNPAMIRQFKVMHDATMKKLPLMERVMALNLLMAKTVISMEARAPTSSTLSSFTTGDGWAVARMPNPGPMEAPGGRGKYLPKTRYIWFFEDTDKARTRAPHGFMRILVRKTQGATVDPKKKAHISYLVRVCEYTAVDLASISSAPIRNYVVASLLLKDCSTLYKNSKTQVGFMNPSAYVDILGASLIFESRMGQYVADALQFAARFNRAASNLWSTIKGTYNDYSGNPFASVIVPLIMSIQDCYEITTDVKSSCMKIKMYSGSAKESNERSMSLGTGEEFQKRMYHSMSHNDDGGWNIENLIRRIMDTQVDVEDH